MTASVTAGCRVAGRSRTGHSLGGPWRWVSRCTSGTRGRSTHLPSFASSAGSTVSEPIIAMATTIITLTASEEKITSCARNSAATDTRTAKPEHDDRPAGRCRGQFHGCRVS